MKMAGIAIELTPIKMNAAFEHSSGVASLRR